MIDAGTVVIPDRIRIREDDLFALSWTEREEIERLWQAVRHDPNLETLEIVGGFEQGDRIIRRCRIVPCITTIPARA